MTTTARQRIAPPKTITHFFAPAPVAPPPTLPTVVALFQRSLPEIKVACLVNIQNPMPFFRILGKGRILCIYEDNPVKLHHFRHMVPPALSSQVVLHAGEFERASLPDHQIDFVYYEGTGHSFIPSDPRPLYILGAVTNPLLRIVAPLQPHVPD